MMQYGPPYHDVWPSQPRSQRRDVCEHRLELRRTDIREEAAGLCQQPFARVHTDQHAMLAQAAENSPAKTARTATELDDPVVGLQRQIIQQALRGVGKVCVLNRKAAGGVRRLPKYVVVSWGHRVQVSGIRITSRAAA